MRHSACAQAVSAQRSRRARCDVARHATAGGVGVRHVTPHATCGVPRLRTASTRRGVAPSGGTGVRRGLRVGRSVSRQHRCACDTTVCGRVPVAPASRDANAPGRRAARRVVPCPTLVVRRRRAPHRSTPPSTVSAAPTVGQPNPALLQPMRPRYCEQESIECGRIAAEGQLVSRHFLARNQPVSRFTRIILRDRKSVV